MDEGWMKGESPGDKKKRGRGAFILSAHLFGKSVSR